MQGPRRQFISYSICNLTVVLAVLLVRPNKTAASYLILRRGPVMTWPKNAGPIGSRSDVEVVCDQACRNLESRLEVRVAAPFELPLVLDLGAGFGLSP